MGGSSERERNSKGRFVSGPKPGKSPGRRSLTATMEGGPSHRQRALPSSSSLTPTRSTRSTRSSASLSSPANSLDRITHDQPLPTLPPRPYIPPSNDWSRDLVQAAAPAMFAPAGREMVMTDFNVDSDLVVPMDPEDLDDASTAMDIDRSTPASATPATAAQIALIPTPASSKLSALQIPPQADTSVQETTTSLASSASALSDDSESELSSVPSIISSRATTPVEPDSSRDTESATQQSIEAPDDTYSAHTNAQSKEKANPAMICKDAQADAHSQPADPPSAPTEAIIAPENAPVRPANALFGVPGFSTYLFIPIKNGPRKRYDVRPKASIPNDLPPQEYAVQCIAAAESSRLNPYALHQEEYIILRDYITHTQITTYLNIRNSILRLWVRNPLIAVTCEEAVGCAKDVRWFDVASVCFDWLVRRGYINFGCVEIKSSGKSTQPNREPTPQPRRRRVVVIGAGMSGLSCARQLEGLFKQYRRQFETKGEDMPEVVVLEGRGRIGGRVYSRQLVTKPAKKPPAFEGKRFTAEMGGMIITGFERGNPLNILLRGQLNLAYHALTASAPLYDANGKPVDPERDILVEKLFNDCLDRVSEYKFKNPTSKLLEGNRELMDEGGDNAADLHKSIRVVEEATAAQPQASSVTEQNMAPQVNLVPVSVDRATGQIHTKPGMPGPQKAAFKAKLMGWALKGGVSQETDLDLESPTKAPDATLGSVTDHVISQYKELVDLNAQDLRLINWHIANLEYSNATNYHNLSLQGWDIDAGYEWEGKHTMVKGGYQSVARGLLCLPSQLDVRLQAAVKKISYGSSGTDGPAVVECEGGFQVEADYVVNTIPLGVLKHGNVCFEPELPAWKTGAIERLGFGVLNKIILVYKKPFWNNEQHIFGVLRTPSNRHSLDQSDYSSRRGRFFQWFNVSHTSGLPTLLALMAGDAGHDTENTPNDHLIREATDVLRSVFGTKVPAFPVEAIVTRWASDKFARGSYSSAGPKMRANDYDTMSRPVDNLFFAGEHTTGTHPATVHGAYLSGLRAASEVLEAMLGGIEVPDPLIIPKDYHITSLKRKLASETSTLALKDPIAARRVAYDMDMWDRVVAKMGARPLKPPRAGTSAYNFFCKENFEAARRRCEEGRRSGKGKPGPNEVRVMSSKMWREMSEDAKRPYEEKAEEVKRLTQKAMEEWHVKGAEWDAQAGRLREQYERDRPFIVSDEDEEKLKQAREGSSASSSSRRAKQLVGSSAQSEDIKIGG